MAWMRVRGPKGQSIMSMHPMKKESISNYSSKKKQNETQGAAQETRQNTGHRIQDTGYRIQGIQDIQDIQDIHDIKDIQDR